MTANVLVTGAGSGIGAATARLFAADGARVLCADLDPLAAQAVAAEVSDPSTVSACALDVRTESHWERALELLAQRHGPLDVLVHCAGISAASPIHDTELAEWRRVMSTNLDGAFLAVKHGARALRERAGVIVLVGSASGIRPAAGAAAYSVSKAGLGMLVRVAAKELRDGDSQVRVCAVSPAGVRTPMWLGMPFFQDLVAKTGSEAAAFDAMEKSGGGRFADADDIARAIRFLASDDAKHITGVELSVDSGYVL
ncbi:MAG: SDR family oxidoreductase [bacterium]